MIGRSLAGVVVVSSLLLGSGIATSEAGGPPPRARCPVSLPNRSPAPDTGPGISARAFNHGHDRLRAGLYWPDGVVRAGLLPDGGVMATIAPDGSVSLKLGWWRGTPGRLRITGRRLDGPAAPLRAHVPGGYGSRGFQATGLTFPTVGCWRVVGRVGPATLAFVLRVTKLPG